MRLFLLLVGLITGSILNAQSINDALTYTDGEIQGSARYRGLSGAMGALGGDPSAININPASSSVFNTSYASVSLAFTNTENNALFGKETTTSDYSRGAVNQVGAALVFENTKDSPWKKFTLGLSFDKTKDHNHNWLVRGKNTNSIDSYFLAQANGISEDAISLDRGNNESITDAYARIGQDYGYSNQQAFLGYESFILEPTSQEGIYTSNILANSFDQEYRHRTSGSNGKFSINLSTQYEKNLYLGVSVNSHYIDYSRSTTLAEDNDSEEGSINSVRFKNTLTTTGSGLSFQAGAIAKLDNGLRAGISFNSPTWYQIEETTTDYIRTTSKGITLSNDDIFKGVTINPDIENVYEAYTLQTQWNTTGSLAYVFGKKGLISVDYILKDYSSTKFKPQNDEFFKELNTSISKNLGTAATIKVGGEYRIDKLSLRGGYYSEETPNPKTINLGNINGYSLGFGYDFGNMKLDFSYNNSRTQIGQQLYSIGLVDKVYSKFNTSNITATLGIRL